MTSALGRKVDGVEDRLRIAVRASILLDRDAEPELLVRAAQLEHHLQQGYLHQLAERLLGSERRRLNRRG